MKNGLHTKPFSYIMPSNYYCFSYGGVPLELILIVSQGLGAQAKKKATKLLGSAMETAKGR